MPAMPSLSPPRVPVRFPGRTGAPRHAATAARTLVALALAGSVLGACSSGDDKFPPVCPGLTLLPDAADMTRFDGKGIDVTNLVVRASITAVPAKCESPDPGTVRATLNVDADIRRGPAGSAALPPIGYFIALMRGDTVLREQDFAFNPQFAPNVDRASVHGDDIELLLPVSKTKTAAVYKIYVGFRLTPGELAYNRTHARP
jgi:hypothetical protein